MFFSISKKRPREGSNIATITRSLSTMPTPPPPRSSPIFVDSPLPTEELCRPITPTKPTLEASRSPLSILGDELQFSKGVRVDLNSTAKGLIWVVPEEDLLQGNIDLFCQDLVLARLGVDARGRRVEEISLLEHELAEGLDNLK